MPTGSRVAAEGSQRPDDLLWGFSLAHKAVRARSQRLLADLCTNVEGEDAQTRARPSEYRDQTIRILLDQTPIQDQKVRLNPLNLPSEPGGRGCIPDNLEAQIVHEQESEGTPHRNFAISYDGSDLASPLLFPLRSYGEELAERARQVESLLPGEKSGFLPGQLTR